MNDETGLQNRTVNAIATSKVRISLCLFIQNPPCFYKNQDICWCYHGYVHVFSDFLL